MSNTWLNLRFGEYHLQVVMFGDWRSTIRSGRSPVTFRRNAYQATLRAAGEGWRWFEAYEVRWPW